MSRTAGEAELDGLRQTGKGYRHGAERDAKGDPDEERNEMRFVEFLERVADGGGRLVKVGVTTDNLNLIANLQPQARHGLPCCSPRLTTPVTC